MAPPRVAKNATWFDAQSTPQQRLTMPSSTVVWSRTFMTCLSRGRTAGGFPEGPVTRGWTALRQ